jgi:succinyl-CoA synthetase beta subunit
VLAPLVSALPLELRPTIEAFLANCLAVFDDLDATLLEMNPFTFDSNGMPFPLDIRMVSCLCGWLVGCLVAVGRWLGCSS